jgi:hypothetical protein
VSCGWLKNLEKINGSSCDLGAQGSRNSFTASRGRLTRRVKPQDSRSAGEPELLRESARGWCRLAMGWQPRNRQVSVAPDDGEAPASHTCRGLIRLPARHSPASGYIHQLRTSVCDVLWHPADLLKNLEMFALNPCAGGTRSGRNSVTATKDSDPGVIQGPWAGERKR